MSLTISEYTESLTPEVIRFNRRLQAAEIPVVAPASPVSKWLPGLPGRKLFQEYFVAWDETSVVRGAYTLKHQQFQINGQAVPIGFYHEPISEGIVERAYSQVGVKMLLDGLKRQPLLYCLGMGGFEGALPRMLAGLRWEMFAVPFYFRVQRPFRFLRNIQYLRRSPWKRAACDFCAFSGLGWLGAKGWQAARRKRPANRRPAEVEIVDEFGDWADELWERSRRQYRMCAVRDAETLRLLYPKDNGRFIRLRVSAGRKVIGWAVCLNTRMSAHEYFGNMRLGSIADCFAALEDASEVIRAAGAVLNRQAVDVIVSNQSHAAWCRALTDAGFMHGPSNEVFAASKELTRLLKSHNTENDQIHVNRGDGDGPVHL